MTSKAVTKRIGRTGPVSITAEGLKLVRKRAANGVSLSSIAQALGIDTTTFRKMRKDDESLAEAVEIGRGEMESELVGRLMELSRSGSLVASIFLLKSMRGFVEGRAPEGSGGPVVNITIPAAMSKEEFAKVIEIDPEPTPIPETQKVIR